MTGFLIFGLFFVRAIELLKITKLFFSRNFGSVKLTDVKEFVQLQ